MPEQPREERRTALCASAHVPPKGIKGLAEAVLWNFKVAGFALNLSLGGLGTGFRFTP